MTIGGLLIAIETILTYVFTYQLIHVYEKLIRIAIIASLAMFGKPCILVISCLLKLYLPVVIAHILLPPSYRILLCICIYTYFVLRSCLTDGQTLP